MTRSLTIVASRRLRGRARTMDAGRDYGQPRKFHHAGQRVPVEVLSSVLGDQVRLCVDDIEAVCPTGIFEANPAVASLT